MKFKNTAVTPARLTLLCVAGLLVILGIVAENQPWGRGWFHDLKYAAQSKFSRGAFSLSPGEFDPNHEYYEYPDEPSPEMKKLQLEIDQWYPEAIETYPWLEVEHKSVADDQNGFLKIVEWQEEFDSPQQAGKYLKFPDHIKKIHAKLFSIEKTQTVSGEQISAIETYLKSKQDILDRAIAIGLLPGQSDTNIVPDRYWIFPVHFVGNISSNLKLRALIEAKHGDFEAAFLTLKALRGWGNHIGKVEAPTLIMTTSATAIHLGTQELIHSQILPLLLEERADLSQWAELSSYHGDIQQQRTRMWRGEWYHFIKARYTKQILLDFNPRDTMALVASYSSMMNHLADPKTLVTEPVVETPSIPNHLTRKSRALFEIILLGLDAYELGYLRSQAILKQYELAFALRKLQAEGQALNALDQKTLASLPLQILPGADLTIDFDERSISAPQGQFHRVKPMTF